MCANALERDASKERPKQDELTRFWGDESWKAAAYESQPLLFGGEELQKRTNQQFAHAFRDRLKTKAAFRYVASRSRCETARTRSSIICSSHPRIRPVIKSSRTFWKGTAKKHSADEHLDAHRMDGSDVESRY